METINLLGNLLGTLLGLALAGLVDGEVREDRKPAPKTIRMVDLDGNDRLDRLELGTDGTLSLALNRGQREFEAVVQDLPSVIVASLFAGDLNGDGHTDLYLVSPQDNVALIGDGTGRLVEATVELGLSDPGDGVELESLDIDGDGVADVLLHNRGGDVIFWGTPEGVFEREAGPTGAPLLAPVPVPVPVPEEVPHATRDETSSGKRPHSSGSATRFAGGIASGATRSSVPVSPDVRDVVALPFCARTIEDASTDDCLFADSTPTLGRLYPLSLDFNLDLAGNVGLGTTTPAARLDVAGTVRITDTLTLEPQGDQALNLAAGNIYKQGELFLHTPGDEGNLAMGTGALLNVTSGASNTAIGARALTANTTGSYNSACGDASLYSNTTGSFNTAMGPSLFFNTTGSLNTALGFAALAANTSGNNNTAVGHRALLSNTTGFRNTASGADALTSNMAGVGNTATGYRALVSNTGGFLNTATGNVSMYSNTTGFHNTASGYRTLFSNTTGNANTASGFQALAANTTGSSNVAVGNAALGNNTVGSGNIAVGEYALVANTSGTNNTGSGRLALRNNTDGSYNTASGAFALNANTSGSYNTSFGYLALRSNTTGNGNTAVGNSALSFNTEGIRNIAIGESSGSALTTGSDNIAIGSFGTAGESGTIRLGVSSRHSRAFLAGVRGVTTGVANAIPVVVDSAGQLGTVSSSRRFKEEIQDMGTRSERLLALRPVVFRYKPEVQNGERPLEYGLIAEEVAEVFPELVVRDEEGEILTVKYHLLSSILLNELQKLSARVEELEGRAGR